MFAFIVLIILSEACETFSIPVFVTRAYQHGVGHFCLPLHFHYSIIGADQSTSSSLNQSLRMVGVQVYITVYKTYSLRNLNINFVLLLYCKIFKCQVLSSELPISGVFPIKANFLTHTLLHGRTIVLIPYVFINARCFS